MAALPVIPDYITVHLGKPSDASAPNIRVPFIDYIKNVASSEIYPTWPENAIRANIYAIISFALNRIYTEFYRAKGFDFDITNSTQYDQAFVEGRDIFQNISDIVDELFDDYLVRQGSIEPFFAQFCDGINVTCPGLAQWGTVPLAEQGLTPYEILQHYYGDNINIVKDAPVKSITPSYPGAPVKLGQISNDVRTVQVRLNRIGRDYPAIPKIYPIDSSFGVNTENAVKKFQEIFNLPVDGIVGKATWYKIESIYNGVKKLSELSSEGLRLEEVSGQFPETLQEGSTGRGVSVLQYHLAVISQFYDQVPDVAIDGIFGPETTNAVKAFQRVYGLTPDGIVGRNTWNDITRAYQGIVNDINYSGEAVTLYPGIILSYGMDNQFVAQLQRYLAYIANTYKSIPAPSVTGYFGDQTRNAVRAFQNQFGLNPSGVVDAVVWDAIAGVYSDLRTGNRTAPGQYPGFDIKEE